VAHHRRRRRPALPDEFRTWLLRMLQLDTGEAYASAVDAWADLETILGTRDNGASFVALEAVLASTRDGRQPARTRRRKRARSQRRPTHLRWRRLRWRLRCRPCAPPRDATGHVRRDIRRHTCSPAGFIQRSAGLTPVRRRPLVAGAAGSTGRTRGDGGRREHTEVTIPPSLGRGGRRAGSSGERRALRPPVSAAACLGGSARDARRHHEPARDSRCSSMANRAA
jgi:hypothetical protein